ncbi:MAG TPA: hypothetical protein VE442_24745 [Jatrophihabitans sp.]|jgi:hypothetical protein|nr:hypothetical protein [Jatrophihabitans sp.]
MRVRARDAVAVVAGAACAYGADTAIARLLPRFRAEAAAGGLVTIAAIYPLARRRITLDAALAREAAALAANSGIVAVGRTLAPNRARALLGFAWAAHAVFDVVHTTSGDSRLPSWYASMCAGYDLMLGARLVALD